MARFLIDANLPNRLALWNTAEFELVADHDDSWSDSVVWEYARNNNLTIVTKDADFSDRIMTASPPPESFICASEIFGWVNSESF